MALFYKYLIAHRLAQRAPMCSLGLYIGFKECCIRVQLHYITLHLTDVVDVYAI